jgi:uroporphyrin-III C-methyltransferase/precorrin-2 dehydrogenase/sirohydrochlorin ferrochelatase
MSIDGDEQSTAQDAGQPGRIAPLAILPVFFKLRGKRAVVAGGSDAALWKAELLAAAGSDVLVYAPSFASGFDKLAIAPPNGTVALDARGWQPDDFKGAAIAVGAMDDDAEATRFAAAARAAGVPVNVIDRPEFCDFQFGAIANRSPLIVGISTDGAAPVLAQTIRSLVESLVPENIAHWLTAAKSWRREGRLGETSTERRRFWARFAEAAMRDGGRAPTDADLHGLLEAGRVADSASRHVTLIIAGEGSDTLTLGAVKALRSADAIFYDAGVPADVLGFARREAERHSVASAISGLELANRLLAATKAGNRIVRIIRSGSPPGPARAEVEALREAGAEVDVANVSGLQ